MASLSSSRGSRLMTKVLYIAGYGRSGSTVLDVILGNHSHFVGIGEVSFLLDDWGNSSRLCACGAPYSECQFWKGLFPNQFPPSELAQTVRKIEKLSSVPRLLLGLIKHEDREVYHAYHERLFRYVTSSSQRSIVVDSSKSARAAVGRFLALTRTARQDVYVLHLVRNGLATMESLLVRGRNWALEGHVAPPKWPGVTGRPGLGQYQCLDVGVGAAVGAEALYAASS
jgi:hypothetical protein